MNDNAHQNGCVVNKYRLSASAVRYLQWPHRGLYTALKGLSAPIERYRAHRRLPSAARQPSALMAGAMTSNLACGEAGRVDRCAARTGF